MTRVWGVVRGAVGEGDGRSRWWLLVSGLPARSSGESGGGCRGGIPPSRGEEGLGGESAEVRGLAPGCAFATSDVTVTARRLRWTVTVHSVLAFFYNAVVMAVAFKILTGQ